MAIIDTISFPDIDPLTGHPTIDGWTGNIDPGLPDVNFPEAGYATAGRLAFSGGSHVPPVAFQCICTNVDAGWGLPVAAGKYLAMAFFCSFDPTFDQADGITISILPDFATKDHHTARRIDLLPNTGGVGAGAAGGGYMGTGFDWLPPETPPAAPVVGVDHPLYYSRLNRQPPGVAFWQGTATNPAPTAPPDTTHRWDSIAVNNTYARAASWIPSTVSTATSGAPQSVPNYPSSFTLQVADVSQFPDSGDIAFLVGGTLATVSYTGRNTGSNQFTGCKVSPYTPVAASSTVASGVTVQLLDVGWSVEVLLPVTAALGGANWADLTKNIGLYVNLFRFSQWEPQPPATPHAGAFAAQYRFPLPDAGAPPADQHYLTGILNDVNYIGDTWYGNATIPLLGGNINDAKGVCFQNVAYPPSSVGARHPGSPTPATIDNTLYGATGPQAAYNNTLVAQLQNTDTANAANDVTAEFRFAKWGIPSASFGDWDPASAHNAAPSSRINLPASGSGEVTEAWAGIDIPPDYLVSTYWPGHHCMWVRLDSGSNVNFVQSGCRTNMTFTQLSEHAADATISGSGYPPPSSGSDHDFVLFSHVRSMIVPRVVGDGSDNFDVQPSLVARRGSIEGKQVWYWMVDTFRRTGETFTVGNTTAEIIDPAPGQFGLIAEHDGKPDDVFVHQLSGGGIKRVGNAHQLRVPHKGEVTIHTWIGAGPPGTVNPPKQQDPWWLALIKWLIALIRRLFGK
jgi:hypothetical protein